MLTAVTALIIILADQATKFMAAGALQAVPCRKTAVIENFFYFTLVHNRGAAFGIFPRQSFLFIILSLVTISLLLLFYRRLFASGKIARIAGGLILGGAVGNLIDRIRFDHVVDFLDFQFGTYHWPAFNVADSAICIGVALLIVIAVFGKDKLTHS